MKLLLWQESPWFADPCPVDAVDNCTEGVGIPDGFAGKWEASAGRLSVPCSRSSTVWIICLVVHHKLVVYKVETVRLCLIWMKDHLSNCRVWWGERKRQKKKLIMLHRSPAEGMLCTGFQLHLIEANSSSEKNKTKTGTYPNHSLLVSFKELEHKLSILRQHTKCKCST